MSIYWIELSTTLGVDEAVELVDRLVEFFVVRFSLSYHSRLMSLLLTDQLVSGKDLVLLFHLVSVSNIDTFGGLKDGVVHHLLGFLGE